MTERGSRARIGSVRLPVVMFAVLAATACRTPPPVVPTRPPVPMTLFRADAEELPELTAALNTRIEGTYPQGPTVRYAAVTIEEAQLVAGCADATPECWSAIADPIPTSALLMAEVKPEGPGGEVRISLRLFDAGGQKTLRLSERVYGSAAQALEGVPDLVAALAAPREEP